MAPGPPAAGPQKLPALLGSVAELVTHDNEDKRLAASRLEFGKRPLDTSGYVLSVAAMQVRLLPEPLCFVGDFIYTHTRGVSTVPNQVELTTKEQIAIWGLVHQECVSQVQRERPEDARELSPILRKIGSQGCNLSTVTTMPKVHSLCPIAGSPDVPPVKG